MPPRYAYWTILVDDQPTAFRASSQEDLMPTFNRLKLKHASAKMMWWQNGKLWDSRLDAQEAMRARGEMGRRGDFRQRPQQRPEGKLQWKPKGEQRTTPRPEWRPKTAGPSSGPHALRPSTPPRAKPGGGLEWRPKDRKFAAEGRESRRSAKREGGLDWKPKGQTAAPKRRWIPKEEFKKSQGIEARRDKTWRPGGEHKDPRQKYKDAKKAKWTRFKQTVRKRWEAKGGKKKSQK